MSLTQLGHHVIEVDKRWPLEELLNTLIDHLVLVVLVLYR